MPQSDLTALFEPRGLVVVGASSKPDKLGFAMANSLRNFPGAVQLVNSRPGPGMYESIEEAVSATRSSVDLAVMCVPAHATASALRASAAVGIRAALVCAGGFAEVGGQGAVYASDIDEVVDETGIRLLGPNTSGFFVPGASLYASFVPGAQDIGTGSVAVVAASGGINHVLSFQLIESGAGVSVGVGVGAGRDVSAPEVLRYLVDHTQTRAVILHIESVPDGRALVDAIRSLCDVKPVVVLVVGCSDVSEFAQSHTGALATSWKTTRSILGQAGAVVVDNEEQAVAAAIALSRCRLRAMPSPGVGLVTGQAGPGLIIADALAMAVTPIPRLAESTLEILSGLLPPLTFQNNPVDTGRPSATFPGVISAIASDHGVDIVGVYAITEPVVDLASAIAEARVEPSTPIILAVDGPAVELDRARDSADQAGLALLRGPTRLAQALVAVAEDARRQYQRGLGHRGELPEIPAVDWCGVWDEIRGKDLLDAIGLATPPRRRCADRDNAHDALRELGAPVAIKMVDAAVLHKTEAGGVVLNIETPRALDDALDALEKVGAAEFLVERMAATGIDLVLGARIDPVFGPIVLVGLGGTAAELVGDVSIRTAPLSVEAASLMIEDLSARQLLEGYRGGPVVDRRALGAAIATLGEIVASGKLLEIEINPLRCTRDGLIALDAVVRSLDERGTVR